MDLLEQAQHFLESKGFLVESKVEELGFGDDDSANVFYYIGRYIENKGPQTSAAIEKYLESGPSEVLHNKYNLSSTSFSIF